MSKKTWQNWARSAELICLNDFKSNEMIPDRTTLLQCLNIESQAESERNGQIRSSEIINNTFTFLTSTPFS